MKKLKLALDTFSANISAEIYEHTHNYYRECWRNVPQWVIAAEEDFYDKYYHEAYIKTVTLILNDPTYRQSASGLIMYFGFKEDDDFTVRLECLIDHSHVMEFSVYKLPRSSNKELENLASEIDNTR